MKLIFAQGNPGAEYAKSRHNAGWQILDALATEQGAKWQTKPKFLAEVAETSLSGEKILLVKPQTFYNETGRSARALADFYKLDLGDILVVHDDLAINFGTVRVRQNGSDGGNNGIKSLNAHLERDFWRLRVGILQAQRHSGADSGFVLSPFNSTEQELFTKFIIPGSLKKIAEFAAGKLEVTSVNLLPNQPKSPTDPASEE